MENKQGDTEGGSFIPKQYVGRNKTHRSPNFGQVWTQQPNGMYTCPDRKFSLPQESIDSDVRFGHLVEFKPKTYIATDSESTGLIWVWTQTPRGTYSCPQADFELTQEEVDHDVENGFLRQV